MHPMATNKYNNTSEVLDGMYVPWNVIWKLLVPVKMFNFQNQT